VRARVGDADAQACVPTSIVLSRTSSNLQRALVVHKSPVKRMVAVRPYHIGIRARVLSLLSHAQCALAEDDFLPKGTDDASAIAWLQTRCTPRLPDVLLIPVHQHRDIHGTTVDGLSFARRVHDELPALRAVPIVMPSSIIALAGARLALSAHAARPLPDSLRERVLLLPEDELDSPAMPDVVRAHLASRL
jgi:hypothetical protein